MISGYLSLRESASAEFTEKKSVFIGYATPVTSEEDALTFLNCIRQKHSDATHNVFAYIIRNNNTVRFSDDGEPKGTAGVPVLDVLKKGNITDAAIVVTRYFGGILLGAGGLVRAYSNGAKIAVNAAGIAEYKPVETIEFTFSYADYSRFEHFAFKQSISVNTPFFLENVKVCVNVPESETSSIIASVVELTNGRVVYEKKGIKFSYV